MKARLARLWDRLRTSLWLVPGSLTATAAMLAFGTVALDRTIEDSSAEWTTWVYSGGPEGARSLLATAAGSMTTIAGVTFSMTIVALTMASTQFGPRLLRNFMRDTSNQLVLGTFIATFVYCMLVLRTVRGPEQEVFVPQVSVTTGLLLSILSLGVLIYFIHHVSSSIQADHVIDVVGDECDAVIRKLYPDPDEADANHTASKTPEVDIERIAEEGIEVIASTSGYIQAVSRSELLALAIKHDLVIWFRCRPGDFVIAGSPLMNLWPAARATDDARRDAAGCVAMGAYRTPIQDIEFTINQLVEVASRALSSGVNDPFTAIACVDRLGAILATLAQRAFPPPFRMDDSGTVRMIEDRVTFEGTLDAAFNQIRQYGRTDVSVLIRLLETITAIAEFARRPEARAALLKHAGMVHAAARDIPDPQDRADIDRRYAAARQALANES